MPSIRKTGGRKLKYYINIDIFTPFLLCAVHISPVPREHDRSQDLTEKQYGRRVSSLALNLNPALRMLNVLYLSTLGTKIKVTFFNGAHDTYPREAFYLR